ncbi:SCD1 [Symbiodinium natans]|uniref:SCD1 protein n=1 Tax=Symbiodinium natans TaxID=878477 RepID=A0A812SJV5_9DINO|nr:SCD1 [Symbiodinium natans]
MICQSLANQATLPFMIFLDRRSTDADPFDPQRGLTYRYMGWCMMHKTPKMIEATRSVDVRDLLLDQVVMFQADVDAWWNLSFCHAIPAFATLLWGEELFLGWVIAGCTRSVLAMHINLILLRFQHLWCPQKVLISAADSSEEEEDLMAKKSFTRQASIADVGLAMEQEAQESQPVPPLPLGKPGPSEDGGGVFVKYKVHESSSGADPSVEVKLEPLWRRSTLVDLAKDAVADILQVQAQAVKPDRPLMDLGFDSAGALKLRNKLSRRLKIELPPTLLFDHPTINAAAAYCRYDFRLASLLTKDMVDNGLALLSKRPMTPAHTDGIPAPTAQPETVLVEDDFHSSSSGLKLYWDMLADKKDAVVEVPLARAAPSMLQPPKNPETRPCGPTRQGWDHELYYSKEPQEGKTYARHGGFVEAWSCKVSFWS